MRLPERPSRREALRRALVAFVVGVAATAAAATWTHRVGSEALRGTRRAALDVRLAAWRAALVNRLRLAAEILDVPARIQEAGRTVDPPRFQALAALARRAGVGMVGVGWAPRVSDGGFPVRHYHAAGEDPELPGGRLDGEPGLARLLRAQAAAARTGAAVRPGGGVLVLRPAYASIVARTSPLQREAGLTGFFFAFIDPAVLLDEVRRTAAAPGERAWLAVGAAGAGPTAVTAGEGVERGSTTVMALGLPWTLRLEIPVPTGGAPAGPTWVTAVAGLALSVVLAVLLYLRGRLEERLHAALAGLRLAHRRRRRDLVRLGEAEAVAALGHWEWLPERRRMRLSRGARRLLGLAEAEVTRAVLLGRVAAEDRPRVAAAVDRAVEQGEAFDIEHRVSAGDALRTVRHSARTCREGGVWRVLAVLQEVTEQRVVEQRLRRMRRAHEMLAGCRRALVEAADEEDLAARFCREVVRTGGYRFAWIGRAEATGERRLCPVAHAGREQGYLRELHLSWREDARPASPGGVATRTGRPVVCRDIDTDPVFAPWREVALARGFRSMVALPLHGREVPLGVFSIYAAEPDAFDANEVELLQGLADDLARRIEALRAAAERDRAAAEGRLREAALDAAGDGILIAERKGGLARVTYVNRALVEMIGWPASWAHGRTPEEVLTGSGDPAVAAALAGVFAPGQRRRVLMRCRRRDGSGFWARLTVAPVEESGGRHHVAVVEDVSELIARQEALERQVLRDETTGLPGEVLLRDRMEQLLALARRGGRGFAVVRIELPELEPLRLGRGDEAVAELRAGVARDLQKALRDADTVAVAGTGGFVVLLTDATDEEAVRGVSARIVEVVSAPRPFDGSELRLRVVVGMALARADADDPDTLLRRAWPCGEPGGASG